jgi:hypothetical protein
MSIYEPAKDRDQSRGSQEVFNANIIPQRQFQGIRQRTKDMSTKKNSRHSLLVKQTMATDSTPPHIMGALRDITHLLKLKKATERSPKWKQSVIARSDASQKHYFTVLSPNLSGVVGMVGA